jgi:hypothetical protein
LQYGGTVFGAILTLIVTILQAYVFWRASSVPFVRRRISRMLLTGVGFVLWASFLLGRVVGPEDIGSLATALELWSMSWMATFFLMCVALLEPTPLPVSVSF